MDYDSKIAELKKVYQDKYNKFKQDIEITVLTRKDVVERAIAINQKYNLDNDIFYISDENGKKKRMADYQAVKNVYLEAPGNLYSKVQKLINSKISASDIVRIACDETVEMFNKVQSVYKVSATYDAEGQPNFVIEEGEDEEAPDVKKYSTFTSSEIIDTNTEIHDIFTKEISKYRDYMSNNPFVLKKCLDTVHAKVAKEYYQQNNIVKDFVPLNFTKSEIEFYKKHPDSTSIRDYWVTEAKKKAHANNPAAQYGATLDFLQEHKRKEYDRFVELLTTFDRWEEDESLEKLIVQSAFLESVDASELEYLADLSTEEFKEGLADFQEKLKIIKEKKSKFAKYYRDEKGETPFKNTALIYIKPKWQHTGFGIDDFENVTDDFAKQYEKWFQEQNASLKERKPNDKSFVLVDMKNDGTLLDIEQSRTGSGNIKIAKDDELDFTYNFFVKYFVQKCKNNLSEVIRMIDKTIDYYKNYDQIQAEKNKDTIMKLASGEYVYSVINGQLVLKKPETEEEIKQAAENKRKADASFEKFHNDEFAALSLHEAISLSIKKASSMFEKQVQELKREADLKLLAKMPKLNMDKISQKVVGNFEKKMKSVASVAKTQKNVTPKSANTIQGFGYEFKQNINYTINFKKKKKALIIQENEINVGAVKISKYGAKDIKQTWTYHMNLAKPTAIVRKSGLKPWPVPESIVKNQILKNNYGNMRAAIFFQLLISNTPVDERYHYEETRVYIKKGKYKKTETFEGVKFERDPEDILSDMVQGAKKVTYTIEREHIPDDERVRDYWEFKYKGMTFSMLDSDFQEHDEWFMKPGDLNSIQKVAEVFTKRVETSKVKSINFTYTNTHPRWERLEYGYYKKDSGPWQGEGKFQREHGVKDHFTYQAPKGWIRLIEAQWNQILETGQDSNILAAVINAEGFNAATVSDEIIKDLKKYESTLGTHEYDYNNFVIIQGE
ncbi:MAG: hypothetical protein MJZ37_00625 [Bacilli bacterium]|nr:hypothetical protein [Bacilli bacterium]